VILPDVNILIYAFREDCAEHVPNKQWLADVVNSVEPFGLSPQVLNSFVRIVTGSSAFGRLYPVEHALAFGDDLLNSPLHRTVQPGRRHWRIFSDLCRQTRVRGKLLQDAWFAALAIEHDCEWITHDRDYARFPGLRWRPPF
jgi:uncharacterized protein